MAQAMKMAYRAVMFVGMIVFVIWVWIPAVWHSNLNRWTALEISTLLVALILDSLTQLAVSIASEKGK